LNRVGALEVASSGRKVNLAYTTGWVDYQPGDLPPIYSSAPRNSFIFTKRRQREFLLDAGTSLSGCRSPREAFHRVEQNALACGTYPGAPAASCWGLQPPDRFAPGATLPLLIGVCNHTIRLCRATAHRPGPLSESSSGPTGVSPLA